MNTINDMKIIMYKRLKTLFLLSLVNYFYDVDFDYKEISLEQLNKYIEIGVREK